MIGVASLVEELVNILEEEEKLYGKLLEYGEQKKDVLVQADIPGLERITALEKEASDELLSKSNKQGRILQDIATVLGKSDEQMTVTKLIGYLDTQPDMKLKLQSAKDKLVSTAGEMQRLNKQNEILIAQAIEMTEFDITLFKSMRQAPETANYDKNAVNTGTILGSSGFDAKQ